MEYKGAATVRWKIKSRRRQQAARLQLLAQFTNTFNCHLLFAGMLSIETDQHCK